MDTKLYWQGDSRHTHFPYPMLNSHSLADTSRQSMHVLFDPERSVVGLATGGHLAQWHERPNTMPPETTVPIEHMVTFEHLGTLPPSYPEWLGDRAFLESHQLRFPYIGGAMARGIASADMVIALGRVGCLGFFGSAGLSLDDVEAAILTIKQALDPIDASWGVNLIHTPAAPELEEKLIDLYLQHGVKRVSAAAFMGISRALARYACQGLYRDAEGIIRRRNYVFAKISRPEVAQHFLSPVPQKLLNELLANGHITASEAELAQHIPLAEDITVESDSGGHTDGRPLNALYSVISELRNALQAQFEYATPVRLGCAGSLGTPQALAAAFALGASYVLVGSVHQSCVESGLHLRGRQLLAQAGVADMIATPSADMFEIGGKVQILKKGTMMGLRGNRLLDIYQQYESLDDMPDSITTEIETTIFKAPIAHIWELTQTFFNRVDPREVARAQESGTYKMALVFRWYLGNSSKWALTGDTERVLDYQIWCGPAMGAFNAWVKGSFLEALENRHVQQVALNLLEGAAHITRAQQLRTFGVAIHPSTFQYTPKQLSLAVTSYE